MMATIYAIHVVSLWCSHCARESVCMWLSLLLGCFSQDVCCFHSGKPPCVFYVVILMIQMTSRRFLVCVHKRWLRCFLIGELLCFLTNVFQFSKCVVQGMVDVMQGDQVFRLCPFGDECCLGLIIVVVYIGKYRYTQLWSMFKIEVFNALQK